METPRLLIRRFREDDAEALALILADPEVMRCLEPPFSREQTEAFLRRAGLCEPPLVYAVIWKETGALIGHLIWHPFDDAAMELGWVLARAFWGRGVAGELTEALLSGCGKAVVLECDPRQAATRRLAARFGFTPVSEKRELCVYRREARG